VPILIFRHFFLKYVIGHLNLTVSASLSVKLVWVKTIKYYLERQIGEIVVIGQIVPYFLTRLNLWIKINLKIFGKKRQTTMPNPSFKRDWLTPAP